MIKRRFYRLEHGDKGGGAESSSDSEPEVVAASKTSDNSDAVKEKAEGNDKADRRCDQIPEPQQRPASPSSSSSGYESEPSSVDELELELDPVNSAGDDDDGNGKELDDGNHEVVKPEAKSLPVPENLARCILRQKSVFRCKLCPKIICLNEDSLLAHLNSKRHSRSEKLLNDGRLTRMLNSNGVEIVLAEDGETHAERYARTIAPGQDEQKKKRRGRQRQSQRRKRKQGTKSITTVTRQETESLPKKKRKNM